MTDASKSCFNFISSFFVVIVTIALACGLGIALIVVGALNLENCSARENIPLWAVVHGSILTVCGLVGLAFKGQDKDDISDHTKGIYSLLLLIAFCTWIWGQVEVFPCGEECPVGCYIHMYNLALAACILPYAALGFALFCGCLGGCCSACLGESK